jgi:hypothetical protein
MQAARAHDRPRPQRAQRDATVLPLPRRPAADLDDEIDLEHVEPAAPTRGPTRARTPLSVPGDFGSIEAIWNGSPKPLSALVGNVTNRLGPDRTPADIGMAGWALIVALPLSAICHLASWIAQHPARSLAFGVLGGVLVLVLTT